MSIWKLSTGEIIKNATGDIISCADCPCVETCECCDTQPTSWTVDLGAGGLVDDECDYCDQLAGEFVLTANGCNASYQDNLVCTVADNDCEDTQVKLSIALSITKDFANRCVISVVISLSFVSSTICSGSIYSAGYVFRSGAGATLDCIANDYTLDLDFETNSSYSGGLKFCTGNLPATITVTGA
jgi:hypothetical protein